MKTTTRKLATVSMVVLPLNHPLAAEDRISFAQLKNEHFLRVPDTGVPGNNPKITEFCRRFGKFKPRFAAMREITRLTEGLSVAADEGEILVNLIFISHFKIPNAVMVPSPTPRPRGMYLLPGNDARPPVGCGCWSMRLALNLRDKICRRG